ncbi:MAG TPA: 50S ribosomal protein L4 [Dictyoglomaceae bacterium]|nr:50S ribosomal protein L4 [Dictyoglomaceae bacterium]HOL38836.1 50S ribosomal protein L4 [Dictyoglomaceae bacterium]HOP94460.1 50S ribosomal protein L4 [Dictyoglomaceae bacterium]HPP15416.1 50S ribosomal protein L4 [Dictyoglomaceae bacterium]HPU43192.1 50S ribosomal protein L4 [Dictyoglomaceae bacterium]
MIQLPVYNQNAEKIGEIELKEELFGVEERPDLFHTCVVMHLANGRQGTHSTKRRSEVNRTGKKVWAQKGTGHARQGDRKAPHWVGGGIAFGPKPRDYSYKIPKKMRRLAIRSALSTKVKENTLILVDKIELLQPKTKELVNILDRFGLKDSKVLMGIPKKDENLKRAAMNLGKVKTMVASCLNVYDLLKYDYLILTVDAIPILEEAFLK